MSSALQIPQPTHPPPPPTNRSVTLPSTPPAISSNGPSTMQVLLEQLRDANVVNLPAVDSPDTPSFLKREDSVLDEIPDASPSTDSNGTPKEGDPGSSPKRTHGEMNGTNGTKHDDNGYEGDEETQKPKRVKMQAGMSSKYNQRSRKKAFIRMCIVQMAKSRRYHLDHTKSTDLQSFHAGDSRLKFKRLTASDFDTVKDILDQLFDDEESGNLAAFAASVRVEFEIPIQSYMHNKPDGTLKVSIPNETHRSISNRLIEEIQLKMTGGGVVGFSDTLPEGRIYILDKARRGREEMFFDRGIWVKDSVYKFFTIPDGALQQPYSSKPFLVVDVLTSPTWSAMLERAATWILGSESEIGICIVVGLHNAGRPDRGFEKGVYTHATMSVFELDRTKSYNVVCTHNNVDVFPNYVSGMGPLILRPGQILRKVEGCEYPEMVEIRWEEIKEWVAASFEQTGQPKEGEYFFLEEDDPTDVMES